MLDTSVILRLGDKDLPFSTALKDKLKAADQIFLPSVARAEIGIKMSIGKLSFPMPEPVFWNDTLALLQGAELSFTAAHAALLASMPLHHRDPFDRMIAAQCLCDGLSLATTDPIFKFYGVELLT